MRRELRRGGRFLLWLPGLVFLGLRFGFLMLGFMSRSLRCCVWTYASLSSCSACDQPCRCEVEVLKGGGGVLRETPLLTIGGSRSSTATFRDCTGASGGDGPGYYAALLLYQCAIGVSPLQRGKHRHSMSASAQSQRPLLKRAAALGSDSHRVRHLDQVGSEAGLIIGPVSLSLHCVAGLSARTWEYAKRRCLKKEALTPHLQARNFSHNPVLCPARDYRVPVGGIEKEAGRR